MEVDRNTGSTEVRQKYSKLGRLGQSSRKVKRLGHRYNNILL